MLKAGACRRWLVRFTLLAVIWGAAMPLLAAMLPRQGGAVAAEICGVDGVRVVVLDNGTDGGPVGHHAVGDPCAYCRLQQDLPAMAPAPAEGLPAVHRALSGMKPWPVALWVRVHVPWPASHCRAPPASA